MHRLHCLRLLLAGSLFWIPGRAMVPRYSLEDLVQQSNLIVQGTVMRHWTAWDPSHKYIWTHYQVVVTDAIRGFPAPVVVSEPEGSLEGVTQGGSDTVRYRDGERVLLFLFRTPIGYLRSTGGPQGKFKVSADGGAQPEAGAIMEPKGERRRGTLLESLRGMPLEELKRQIRRIAYQ